jgi:5-methylcytosine-specific restriction enzyme A
LLLTPTADLLFDRGWITFETSGRLLVAGDLPAEVSASIGLKLKSGRACGSFNPLQSNYLQFHQNTVFEKRYRTASDPVADLLSNLSK